MSKPQFLTFPKKSAGSAPLSPAVRTGDYVHVSGQVPTDENGTLSAFEIEGQTRQVMQNLEKALALAGCDLGDICKTVVWLADARDFRRFNTVYASFFKDNFPARSTTEARLMGNFLIEIEALAYKPL